jgi:hypothetical protein
MDREAVGYLWTVFGSVVVFHFWYFGVLSGRLNAMRRLLTRATVSATECGRPDAVIIALAKVAALLILSSLICLAESLS